MDYFRLNQLQQKVNYLMFETLSYWLFLFFLFNVMGWTLESAIESLYHRRLINRGFLAGPYIPIYGVGGILLAIVGMPFRENGFVVYIVGMAVATVLEYCVGSILERVFKKQFWDYSMLPFTYKNRISLMSSFFWGVQALFVTYVLYDVVSPLVSAISHDVRIFTCAAMVLIMGVDALIQIKRQINIREFMSKFSHERIRENLLKTIMRIGKPNQIRLVRAALEEPLKIGDVLKETFKSKLDKVGSNGRQDGLPEESGED